MARRGRPPKKVEIIPTTSGRITIPPEALARLEKISVLKGQRRVKVVPPKPAPKPRPYGKVTINLRGRHTVNAQTYGPGEVTVRQDLADLLQEQERNALREQHRFSDPSPMGRLIGQRRRVVKVDPALMDEALARGVVNVGAV